MTDRPAPEGPAGSPTASSRPAATHIVTSTRATGPADLPAALETYRINVIDPLG